MKRLLTPRAAVLAAALGGMVGCSSKGVVEGQVTFDGKPVAAGSVTLFAPDDVPYSGAIEPDGRFAIPEVPHGPVKITVSSPNPGGGSRGRQKSRGAEQDFVPEAAPAPGGWFPIPDRYALPTTTDLTGEVKGEKTELNIALKK